MPWAYNECMKKRNFAAWVMGLHILGVSNDGGSIGEMLDDQKKVVEDAMKIECVDKRMNALKDIYSMTPEVVANSLKHLSKQDQDMFLDIMYELVRMAKNETQEQKKSKLLINNKDEKTKE